MSQDKIIRVTLFGTRLQELILREGLTQRELAEAIGMSQGAISHYLRGTRAAPGVEEAIALARHFGVTVDWLLGVDPSPLALPAGLSAELLAKRDSEIEQVATALEAQAAKLRGLLSTPKKGKPARKRLATDS